MGTRGFIGIVVDGDLRVAYNHYDSYPSGLGVAVLSWVTANRHALTDNDAREASGGPVDLARKLRVVSNDTPPTAEQVSQLMPYANLGVNRQATDDWYCLLHKCQGDIGATLESSHILDASDFPADSLFAEWGYVVDMDAMCLEAYRGFQHKPHNLGRFALMPQADGYNVECGYWPVALQGAWAFQNLPTPERFVSLLESAYASDGDE